MRAELEEMIKLPAEKREVRQVTLPSKSVVRHIRLLHEPKTDEQNKP